MALILVIEPNPRHAAEVAAMAHRHLQAETLITASAARAVTELGDRIPDLVLTAALLPGHEEVALADHLRQLGDAAAHVQTLTIPILSGAAAKMRGLASSLLRDRGKKDAPDGCDPALFAEQVSHYLQRAEEQRRAPVPRPVATPAAESPAPARDGHPPSPSMPSAPSAWDPVFRHQVPTQEPCEQPAEIRTSAPHELPRSEDLTWARSQPAPAPERVVPPDRDVTPSVITRPPLVSTEPPPLWPTRQTRNAVPAPPSVEISQGPPPAHPHAWRATEPTARPLSEPVAVHQPPPGHARPESVRPEPVRPEPPRPEPTALVARRTPSVRPGALTVLPAPRTTPANGTRLSLPPRRIPAPPESDAPRTIVPEVLPPAHEPPAASTPATFGPAPAGPQQVQHVIAIPTGNGTHIQASVNLAVAVSVQVAAGGSVVSASPVAAIATTSAPVSGSKPQDEWGFFDPAQCGFEALIARLDRVERRSD